ncbi:hypothetical protein O6P43_026894 [Quillaja saponaria]|uniref:Uncharacterized protein n=1 Tax=Quillaja saponaria TaxID=32244 RepID=A0AAD7PD57_QUISA|nr:hypothetical protein O6P43_026894 [Quillaja saponaria]
MRHLNSGGLFFLKWDKRKVLVMLVEIIVFIVERREGGHRSNFGSFGGQMLMRVNFVTWLPCGPSLG